MNPTIFMIFGIICIIAAIAAIIFGLVFICISLDGHRTKGEFAGFFISGILLILFSGICIYGAKTLMEPDPETLYGRVLDAKPECDINSVSCLKVMTEWLADSTLSYTEFHNDSTAAAEKYNSYREK